MILVTSSLSVYTPVGRPVTVSSLSLGQGVWDNRVFGPIRGEGPSGWTCGFLPLRPIKHPEKPNVDFFVESKVPTDRVVTEVIERWTSLFVSRNNPTVLLRRLVLVSSSTGRGPKYRDTDPPTRPRFQWALSRGINIVLERT